MDTSARDAEMKKLYLEDATRQAVMRQLNITNNNTMSSISSRNNLHWSWPLENRRSGKEPSVVQFPQPKVPRKRGDNGGGTAHAIQARPVRKERPDIDIPADAPLYVVGSAPRRYGKPLSVLTRQRAERGYQDSDTEFGGRLSPFPTPSEVSRNPNDLSRAEIHAIATLYRN